MAAPSVRQIEYAHQVGTPVRKASISRDSAEMPAAESLSNRSLGAEFCAAVNCQKRWRQKATSPANKRIATAISVNPALILSIGREWGQSKFTFSEASAKTS